MNKKIFFCLLGLIVLGPFSFISCNQDEVSRSEICKVGESKEINESFMDLTNRLEIYDSQFYKENSTQTDTRGFWRWLAKVCKADVVGAAVGAGMFGASGALCGWSWRNVGRSAMFGSLITGIVNSISAAFNKHDQGDNFSFINKNYVQVTGNVDVSGADSIGYYHNLIIQELFSEDPSLLDKNMDIITNRVIQHLNKYGFYNTSSDLFAKLDQSIKLVSSCLDKSEEETKIILSNKYPDLKNEVAIMCKYLDNISSLGNQTDLVSYTEGFRNVVVSSKIPDSSTSFISATTSVAVNSSGLWTFASASPK